MKIHELSIAAAQNITLIYSFQRSKNNSPAIEDKNLAAYLSFFENASKSIQSERQF